MFRDTRLAIQKWAFYLGTPIGGALLANQLAGFPGVRSGAQHLSETLVRYAERSDRWDPAAAEATTHTLMLLLGVGLLFGMASLFKRAQKVRDFQQVVAPPKPTTEESPPDKETSSPQKASSGRGFALFVLHAAVATLIGALIFHSFAALGEVYRWIVALPAIAAHAIGPGVGDVYDSLFVGEEWRQGLARTVAALAAGLLLVIIAGALYRSAVHRKHGPILKRFIINGFTPWWGRWVSGKNIGMAVSRTGIWQLDGYTHIPQDMRAFADVRVIDYRDESAVDDGSIWFDQTSEPRPRKRAINLNDIENIKQALVSQKKAIQRPDDEPLKGKEVHEVVNSIDLHELLRPYYQDRQSDMPPDTDLRATLEILASEPYQDDPIEDLGTETIFRHLQQLPVYQDGGKFQRMYFERDSVGANVPLVTLDEQPRSSLRNTERYHGLQYTDPHKIKPVFIFRHLRGQGAEQGDDFETDAGVLEEGEIETAMNTIRQYRKRWNQILKKGLGQGYTLLFHGQQYTIEEEWLTSIPIGFNRRLRRKFYVRLGNEIVGKIQETAWTALTKWAANNDRRIDLYEPGLVKWNSFGRVLSLFSDYLTYQNRYRQNRLSAALQSRGGIEETMAGR